MKKLLTSLVLLFIFTVIIFFGGAALKLFGTLDGPGVIEGKVLPDKVLEDRANRINLVKSELEVLDEKQILFGDLHVHTTYSTDAFMWSLPYMNGKGASPIADACDYARFCSALDFWSINDHAEASTPRKWLDTKESIQQCNNLSEETDDLVSFLGWEWTQVDNNPDSHYGHKNVIFLEVDDSLVPPRAIGSGGIAPLVMRLGLPWTMSALPATLDFKNRDRFFAFNKFFEEIQATPICPEGVSTKDLPLNCYEEATNPNILFQKLKEWDTPYMVIPHGTTWGYYTPAPSDWKKQLTDFQDDKSQFLFEIYSGHGNSEEYRTWNDAALDLNGELFCPEATSDFLPTCQQTGNIMAQRCEDSGFDLKFCSELVAETKLNSVRMGSMSYAAVNEIHPNELLNAGQCNDCFLPSFNYRPLGSAQYVLALRDFSDQENPKRFKFGFIGSSDNHGARPGTGYKEVDRLFNTEANGFNDPLFDKLGDMARPKGKLEPTYIDLGTRSLTSIMDLNFATDSERQSAYFMSGGLVAAHSSSRSRESIWDALDRKEVYATSGPRILLWFNAKTESKSLAMGSEIDSNESPVFTVKAAGSLKQKPGCPDYSTGGLTQARLEKICNSECYNPSNERRVITRIEVIKILPQQYQDELVEGLVDDVWKTFPCNSASCQISFEDEQFSIGRRDAVYYVRAIEEATPTLSADPLGCEFDENGKCIKAEVCRVGVHKNRGECIAPSEHRAWSSPIFVNYSS
jgi:hypothetical protein